MSWLMLAGIDLDCHVGVSLSWLLGRAPHVHDFRDSRLLVYPNKSLLLREKNAINLAVNRTLLVILVCLRWRGRFEIDDFLGIVSM